MADQDWAAPGLLRCLSSFLFMRQWDSYQSLIMHAERPWVQTSISGNRRLIGKMGCCYAGSPLQYPPLFSYTLSSSLTVFLSSLSPAESEFSDTPRLNFLAVHTGCQSRPGSPAHNPPQQPGHWLSHKPLAPSLAFCQVNDFCWHLASELTGCWLFLLLHTIHSNLHSSSEEGFISAAEPRVFSLLSVS